MGRPLLGELGRSRAMVIALNRRGKAAVEKGKQISERQGSGMDRSRQTNEEETEGEGSQD